MTTMETKNHPAGFVAYEYETIKADRERESLYRDVYRNFGWEFEGYNNPVPGIGTVAIKLKRDRAIKNRPMVLELQRKAENSLQSISQLERSKSSTAVAAAVSIGVVGSAFLAGSVFAITADNWVPGIALGAIGLLGWLAGYFTYGRVKAKRTESVASLIDRHYDVLYSTGEQAAGLLK